MDISITLDPNAADTLTTLIQVGGGFATGVVVAALGFRYARRLEHERWVREDAIRERDRWKSERREVFARHIASCERLVSAGWSKDGKEWIAAHLAISSSLAEVRMLAPDLDPAASDVYTKAVDYFNMLSEGESDPETREAYIPALRAFTAAASKVLLGKT